MNILGAPPFGMELQIHVELKYERERCNLRRKAQCSTTSPCSPTVTNPGCKLNLWGFTMRRVNCMSRGPGPLRWKEAS